MMSKECFFEPYVDRGEVVHESGSYLVNFKKCKECGTRTMIKTKNKVVEGDEDEDKEMKITFDHVCAKCDKKICEHFYSYEFEDGYHKYLMECALCGRGAYEQFAGIKQMYPQDVLDQLKKSEKNKDKNVNKENEKITLDLSSMKQLNFNVENEENEEKNVDDDDEWD